MNRLMSSPQWLPWLHVRRQQKTQKRGREGIIEIMAIRNTIAVRSYSSKRAAASLSLFPLFHS